MRFKLKRRYVIPVVAAVVLAVGGTAAYAAVAASPVSSGMINGCYTTAAISGGHAFVLQNAGTSCPKGTTPISWNQQGRSGPAGPAGPRGPAGPPGPTVTVTATATPTNSSTLTATPNNTCGTNVYLGPLFGGNRITGTGANVGSSAGWYMTVVSLAVTSFTMNLTGTGAFGEPAGTDVMDVYNGCVGPPVATGVTTYSGAPGAYYYIRVYEAHPGGDGVFSLQISAS